MRAGAFDRARQAGADPGTNDLGDLGGADEKSPSDYDGSGCNANLDAGSVGGA